MIRPARHEDAAEIAALWNPVIRDTVVTFNSIEKSLSDVEKLVAERPVFVAYTTQLDGFATYGPFRNGVGYRYVAEHTIVLAGSARGSGLGRRLMTTLENHARESEITALWAGVSAENESGVAFHAAIGFEEIARLPEVGFKFGRFHDLVLMQKRL